MNFIIDLSKKYDCLLIIINKLTRRLQFIANYIILENHPGYGVGVMVN